MFYIGSHPNDKVIMFIDGNLVVNSDNVCEIDHGGHRSSVTIGALYWNGYNAIFFKAMDATNVDIYTTGKGVS